MNEHAPDLSGRIMCEATRLFVTSGYYGISMREIAEAAGITKAAIYYHFRDKEELLLAILRRMLATVEHSVLEAHAAGGTAREQVERMMRAIFALPAEQRALIRLASQESAHISAEAREEFGRAYHAQFIARIAAILEGGMERRELRRADAGLATWMLLGMAYPFFYPAHADELKAGGDALALMVSIFFEGLTAR